MDNSTKRLKKIPINKVTEIYKCDICDKEFKKIYSLKTHINVVHMVKALFTSADLFYMSFKSAAKNGPISG